MDKELLQVTENVGFNDKESKVYIALLSLSHGTVTEISKITELKRPIIYIVLGGLIEKGYVSQLPDKKVNEYQALDPSIVLNKAKTSVKNFSDLLPLLQTLHNKGTTRPKINYIESKEGIWNISDQMSRVEDVFVISSYSRMNTFFPDTLNEWHKNFGKGLYKIRGKHLLPDDPQNVAFGKEFAKNKQKVRVSKDLQGISMDFVFYENKLVITSLEEEPFMVMIESQTLVDSMRPVFDVVWREARDI